MWQHVVDTLEHWFFGGQGNRPLVTKIVGLAHCEDYTTQINTAKIRISVDQFGHCASKNTFHPAPGAREMHGTGQEKDWRGHKSWRRKVRLKAIAWKAWKACYTFTLFYFHKWGSQAAVPCSCPLNWNEFPDSYRIILQSCPFSSSASQNPTMDWYEEQLRLEEASVQNGSDLRLDLTSPSPIQGTQCSDMGSRIWWRTRRWRRGQQNWKELILVPAGYPSSATFHYFPSVSWSRPDHSHLH